MDAANDSSTVRNNLTIEIGEIFNDLNLSNRIKAIVQDPNITDKMKEATIKDIMDEVLADVSKKNH